MELYREDFWITSLVRENSLAQKKQAIYKELIITNYDPRPLVDQQMDLFIFEGTPLQPVESSEPASFNWAVILVPIGVVALAGVGTGAALFIRHRREAEPAEEAEA